MPKNKSNRGKAPRRPKKSFSLPRAVGYQAGPAGAPSTRLRRTERWSSVAGSVGFASSNVKLNPGLDNAFPWLSTIAARYDRYQFTDFNVIFVPTSGTQLAGTVTLTYDPNSLDSGPESMIDAIQTAKVISGPVWVRQTLPLEPMRARKFVRGGTIPLSTDLKTYDYGSVSVSTEGMASTAVVGYIEFSYTIVFHDPQPTPSTVPWPGYTVHFDLNTDVSVKQDTALAFLPINHSTYLDIVDNHMTFNLTTAGIEVPEGRYQVNASTLLRTAAGAAPGTNHSDTTIQCVMTNTDTGAKRTMNLSATQSIYMAALDEHFSHGSGMHEFIGPGLIQLGHVGSITGTGPTTQFLKGPRSAGTSTYLTLERLSHPKV